MMCKFMIQDYGPESYHTEQIFLDTFDKKEPIQRDGSLVTMGVEKALTKLLKYTGLSKP